MLLVALWAAQPLSALLHAEEHAHRFCPEHRTFEETPRGTGQLMAQGTEDGPAFASSAVPASDFARPAHEACPVLSSSTREEALAEGVLTAIERSLDESHPATAPPLRAFSSLSVLDTAPKSSPPARA